uniref:LRRCT domain-containing protein n=1 Tax=Strigops habroptila TaxID=2489341 RepID=A0A672V7T3_STRHB
MLVFCLSVMIKLFFQLDASICPEKCNCSSKNAIHCSGPHIKDLESLNLPCNMTEIHITGTNVTYLQDVFSRMVELQHLILSSNNISLISPAAFKGLRNLTLSRNKLEVLPPGLFLHLHDLSKLTLYRNPLKSLPEVLFGEMRHLGSLWLYHTKLSTIPDFVGLNELNLFHNLKHLQKVYLNSTKLQSLPGDFFTASSELQEVFLDNNPWRCDCQILGFREWLLKSMEIVINVPSLTCQSPLALQNISLVALTADHLKCPPTTAITYQMFSSSYSRTLASLVMEHLTSSWETTVRAVPDMDTSTPTSIPLATPGFTYSYLEDVGQPRFHFSEVPTQTSPSVIVQTNSVRGIDLTTLAWLDEIPARRSAKPYFNTRVAYCQLFLCLYSLVLALQTVTIVFSLYVMGKTRQLLHSRNTPAQPVVLIKFLRR